MAPVGLAGFVAVAASGLWLGIGQGWMVIGVVTALTAWDLDHFSRRLQAADGVVGARSLEKRHLLRLAAVAGLGLLLAAAALGLRTRLGVGAAILLGLLAILGLSQVVRYLRHESV
jgi:hypothetical protein